MKKIFIALAAIVCSMGSNAQTMKVMKGETVVATYTADQADKVVFEEDAAPAVAGAKLNIKVTSSDIATLKAIKVVTDQRISGESNAKVYEVPAANQSPAAEGTVYSVEIPSQEYGYYQIYLSADGTTYKEAMATKNPTGEGSIGTGTDIDYEKNAVQLWADGPYFATVNVGQTTPYASVTDTEGQYTVANVGGYYCWGSAVSRTPEEIGEAMMNMKSEAEILSFLGINYAKDASDGDLSPEEDTATRLWGSAWKMPSKTAMEALVAGEGMSSTEEAMSFTGTNVKCEWMDGKTAQYEGSSVAGYLVTGLGEYSGCSIFLPAAGALVIGSGVGYAYQGRSGFYQTSTPGAASSYAAAILKMGNRGFAVSTEEYIRMYSLSVRAILVEAE